MKVRFAEINTDRVYLHGMPPCDVLPPFFVVPERSGKKSPLRLVPGGAARRSPNRATGGVAGYETPSFPGGESPSEGGGGPSHYYFLAEAQLYARPRI